MKSNMVRNVMLVLLGAMLILVSRCVEDSVPEEVVEEEMPEGVSDDEVTEDMREDAEAPEKDMEESDSIVNPTDFENGVQNP